jgi:hypothetical protein
MGRVQSQFDAMFAAQGVICMLGQLQAHSWRIDQPAVCIKASPALLDAEALA